jgi:NhaP-type Na+/H+ or K+/H+ antiporter
MALELLVYGALAIGLYALVARRLSRSIISGPMFFTAVGFLLVATGLIEDPGGDVTGGAKVVVELALGLVLFSDAMTTNPRSWKDDGELPTRLLLIALPLVILTGAVAAAGIFPEMDLVGAAIVATMLAPTDAALGQPVVSNKRVPVRIREALNIESGLNDGLALPLLLFFIAIAEAQEGANFSSLLLSSIGIAVVVGAGAAWLFARLILFSSEHGWTSPMWRQIAVVMVAVVIFGLTEELGGSGFIAAFVGGLVFGRFVRALLPDIGAFAEDVAEVGTMVAFMVFGGVSLAFFADQFTGAMVIYALLSLTVVRIVPVAISMIGTHLRWPTILYMGWFGPRGLASLVFAAIVILDSDITDTDPIITVVILTVALSILLHGVTAYPGSNAYADWYQRQHEDHDAMIESNDVTHVQERRRIVRD